LVAAVPNAKGNVMIPNPTVTVTAETTKACSHDFIAPIGKIEHAICALCGSEPKYADYADGGTFMFMCRFLPVREWVDIALTCVKVG
jgi:hypothetical protein